MGWPNWVVPCLADTLTVLANTAAMDDRDSISCSYTHSSSASNTRSISVTSSTVTVPSVPDRIIEPLDYYSKQKFHPVHLMDTFQDNRYMVIRKLGYGSFSTVWLARDSKYVIKSCKTTQKLTCQTQTLRRIKDWTRRARTIC